VSGAHDPGATRDPDQSAELLAFVVELGAAMNTAGEPVYVVQERLTTVSSAYGAVTATISAFPTYLLVTMGRGEPAAIELTTTLSLIGRIAVAVDRGQLRITSNVTNVQPVMQVSRIVD
jgi:hypothetical protein